MLKHISNVKWVGSLSLEDADVLSERSKTARKILEFGPGGSTMIMAQSAPQDSFIVSVETRKQWIQAITQRLDMIREKSIIDFYLYRDFFESDQMKNKFDLIFVDGEKSLRQEFALRCWHLLKVDGWMYFHDTKRIDNPGYFDVVLSVMRNKLFEVDEVDLNITSSNGLSSNITGIKKCLVKNPPNNLQSMKEEQREEWTFGDYKYNTQIIKSKLYSYGE